MQRVETPDVGGEAREPAKDTGKWPKEGNPGECILDMCYWQFLTSMACE